MALGLLALCLQTGSRGGLLTLIGMAALLFLRLSGFARALFIVLLLAVVPVFWISSPESARVRYLTMFGVEVQTDLRDVEYAKASSEGRKEMFIRSLIQTGRHPILGVGAGMLQVAEADEAKAAGQRPAWIQAHNAYTQVSSEMGIPGFIFFMGFILGSVGLLRRIRRESENNPDLAPFRHMALMLMLGWVGLCINIVFNHLAYRMYPGVFAGMSVGVYLAFLRESRPPAPVARPVLVPRPKRLPVVS
jgi:O-antigen ligase